MLKSSVGATESEFEGEEVDERKLGLVDKSVESLVVSDYQRKPMGKAAVAHSVHLRVFDHRYPALQVEQVTEEGVECCGQGIHSQTQTSHMATELVAEGRRQEQGKQAQRGRQKTDGEMEEQLAHTTVEGEEAAGTTTQRLMVFAGALGKEHDVRWSC